MARKSKKKAPELFEFTETVVGLSAGDQLDRDYFAYARAVVEDRVILQRRTGSSRCIAGSCGTCGRSACCPTGRS